MQTKSNNQVLLIGVLIGVLVLAFIFDLLIKLLMNGDAILGGTDSFLIWLFPLMQLLLMVGGVGVVWLMVARGGYSRLTSIIYLVVGLFILYCSSVLYILPVPESVYVVFDYLSPGSFLYQASSVAAAVGVFSLAMWKPAESHAGMEAQAVQPDHENEMEEEGADPASSSTI